MTSINQARSIASNSTRTATLACGIALSMLTSAFVAPSAQAATHKSSSKKVVKKKSKAASVAVAATALMAATAEQLQAAQRVLVGEYACEFGKTLAVKPATQADGYFSLHLDKRQWLMKPVLTSTGTIRLEDLKGSTMLMQILTKSMLMDTKAGRRLVDGCVHASQLAAQEQLRNNPQPSNF
jgi:hypothetical protein